MTRSPIRIATCACGRVEVTAHGAPITSAVRYCKDCQADAKQIEALPNASAVADPDGGTAYVLYRKDRIACTKGPDLLHSYKLKDTSATNSVHLLQFGDVRETSTTACIGCGLSRAVSWRCRVAAIPHLHEVEAGRRHHPQGCAQRRDLSSCARNQAARGKAGDDAGAIGGRG